MSATWDGGGKLLVKLREQFDRKMCFLGADKVAGGGHFPSSSYFTCKRSHIGNSLFNFICERPPPHMKLLESGNGAVAKQLLVQKRQLLLQ